jgi:hypothetical protein
MDDRGAAGGERARLFVEPELDVRLIGLRQRLLLVVFDEFDLGRDFLFRDTHR